MDITKLTKHLADDCDISKKKARLIVSKFIDAISIGIKEDGYVRLTGFGCLKKKERTARKVPDITNPSEKMLVPASQTVTFTISPVLKKYINQ